MIAFMRITALKPRQYKGTNSPKNKLRRNPWCMPTGSRREAHETTAALREGELSDLRANSRKREASAKDVREARKKRRSRKHRRPTRRIRRVKLQESGPKNATHSRHPSAGWFDTSLQNTTEVVPEYTVAEALVIPNDHSSLFCLCRDRKWIFNIQII